MGGQRQETRSGRAQLEEVPLSILDGWMGGPPTTRETRESMEGINFRKRNNLTLEWPDLQCIKWTLRNDRRIFLEIRRGFEF